MVPVEGCERTEPAPLSDFKFIGIGCAALANFYVAISGDFSAVF
jgi:hypothetical protein